MIGATYLTDETPSDLAVAVEPTVTLLTPKIFEKKPGAGRLTETLIVSLATIFEVIVTPPEPRPPFLVAN